MACDYTNAARTAYTNMVKCFGDPKCSDYWKLGNAFDSMTDYLRWWGGPDIGLAKVVFDRYMTLTNPGPNDPKSSDCWYDDYGWWGIASAKAYDPAYDRFVFTGEYKGKFQAIAKFCWQTFNEGKPWSTSGWNYKGAPNVWTNRDNGKPDTHYWDLKANWATPRFDNGVGSGLHGVWQYEIFREHRLNECSYYNPCDPKTVPLGPFQLTVVNALYFLLALRLYNVAQQPVKQSVLDEWGFLRAWFSKSLGADSLLLSFGDTSVPPALLVRERVTTYAEIDGEYPPVQQWYNELGACWNGDQGLMLAALVELLQAFHDPSVADTAISILRGVLTQMTTNQILQANIGLMGDPEDYKSGVGVFARCFLYAYSQPNSPLKPPVDKNTDNIRGVLLATADHLCKQSSSTDLFDNLNLLSILTAAKVLGVIT